MHFTIIRCRFTHLPHLLICTLLLLNLFISANVWATGHPYLVKDINPGSSSALNKYEPMAVLGDSIIFKAYDPVNGYELWKSNGTSDGTTLLKDIKPGSSSSNPNRLTVSNGRVFFVADDGISGQELWITDGAEAGTTMIKDLNPGPGGSSPWSLMVSNGTLFFLATTSEFGTELWKSDGTAAGTVLVKDITPGTASSNFSYLTDVNGTLFFFVKNTLNVYELWKSDATTEGTIMVKQLPATFNQFLATSCNGQLFFKSNDSLGYELWRSDGTSAGTVMVKDINPGSSDGAPGSLTCIDSTLYFNASDGIHGAELWQSDGTAANTIMIKDIYPGISGSNPIYFAGVNGTVVFAATTPGSANELWHTDGSEAGTSQFLPISAGGFFDYGAKLFFSGNDGSHGNELWLTDGAVAGTYMLGDLYAGAMSSSPGDYVKAGSMLFFVSETQLGSELSAISLNPAPHSLILSPMTSSITNTVTVTISGEAHSDTGSPLTMVEVSTDGGTTWSVASGTSAWSLAWNPTTEGTYALLSRATDLAGSIEVPDQPVQVTVDRTPPVGWLKINNDAATTTTTPVTLSIHAEALDPGVTCTFVTYPFVCGTVSIRFSNNGTDWSGWASAQTVKAWTLSTGDGEKTVYAQLKDRAGNTTDISDTIILDTTLAAKSTITQPASGLYTNQGTLFISGTATPGQGATLVRVEVSTNGGTTWQTANGTSSWSLTVTLADGQYTIKSRAIDSAGYTEIPLNSTSVTIDRAPPTGTLTFYYGEWTLNASDGGICIQVYPYICGSIEMSFNSFTWQPATTHPGTGGPLWLRDRAGNTSFFSGSYADPNGGPVQMSRATPVYYSLVQHAYDAALNGDLIKLSNSLTENLTLARSINLTLRGGYASGFATVTGTTPITGNLSVQAGTASIENIDLTGAMTVAGGTVSAENLSVR